jgi:hypothetical protein
MANRIAIARNSTAQPHRKPEPRKTGDQTPTPRESREERKIAGEPPSRVRKCRKSKTPKKR